MIQVRHTNELVGGLVLVAIGVMLFAALQAGVLRDWFRATSELRLIFPEMGVAGMEVGADVEILGTKAGVVRRIVIEPNLQMVCRDRNRLAIQADLLGASDLGIKNVL